MQNTQSVKVGLTPTNKNVCFEDQEWWVRGNKDGGRRRLSSHNAKNKKRMFVDGKYIPQSHPLWKSGRYKSFNDAAFSSLQNYTHSTKGCVYVIKNPVWPEWVKVGKAVDAKDRLKSYQTSDPFRSYILSHYIEVENRHTTELEVHQQLESISSDRKNEWFKIPVDGAVTVLNTMYKDISNG